MPFRTCIVVACLAVSLLVNLALAVFYGHLRADQRVAALASLGGREHRSGPTIILGDSVVADLVSPDGRLVNLAVPGATVDWIASQQVAIVDNLRPKRIFLAVGINDLRNGTSPEQTVDSLLGLATKLESTSRNTKVILLAILPPSRTSILAGRATPSNVARANRLLIEGATQRGIAAIDYSTLFSKNDGLDDRLTYDGLHLNVSGMAILQDMFFHGLAPKAPGKTE